MYSSAVTPYVVKCCTLQRERTAAGLICGAGILWHHKLCCVVQVDMSGYNCRAIEKTH